MSCWWNMIVVFFFLVLFFVFETIVDLGIEFVAYKLQVSWALLLPWYPRWISGSCGGSLLLQDKGIRSVKRRVVGWRSRKIGWFYFFLWQQLLLVCVSSRSWLLQGCWSK